MSRNCMKWEYQKFKPTHYARSPKEENSLLGKFRIHFALAVAIWSAIIPAVYGAMHKNAHNSNKPARAAVTKFPSSMTSAHVP